MSRFNQIKYMNEYNKTKYDRIVTMIKKDMGAAIRQHAAARGESVNAFLRRAALEQIERDNAEDARQAATAPDLPQTEPPTVTRSASPAPDTLAQSETVTPLEQDRAGKTPKDSTPPTDGDRDPARPQTATEDGTPAPTPAEDKTTPTETEPETPTPHRGRKRKQTAEDTANAEQLTLDDRAED